MDKGSVRTAVEEFRLKHAYGNSVADCFTPWFLREMHGMSDIQAMQHSSDGGGHDSGIDAFFIDSTEPGARKLIVVQAKFTDSLDLVSRGFRDLERALVRLQGTLECVGSDAPIEDKVLVNLRAAVNRLDSDARKSLKLEFVVIHLSDEHGDIIGNRTRNARESLRSSLESQFSDYRWAIRWMGPQDFGPGGKEIHEPEPWTTLTLSPVTLPVSRPAAKMHLGVGRLSELVELYRQRRDELFAKNVRYFLYRKRNTETGAAGKMRETLKRVCIPGEDALQPEVFGLYHNGVTMCATESKPDGQDGKFLVHIPYVLNGCQTVKNAYHFRYVSKDKGRIDLALWDRVTVPLRILDTRDDELVRTVTVNNNRQNAISYAALRANDPVQLLLQERFAKADIFYERQEGAFANVENTNPEVLEERMSLS